MLFKGHLWSHEFPSPPFHSPVPKIRLVLSISTLRVGSSFWRWFSSVSLPGFATWLSSLVSFLLALDVRFFPCTLIAVSSMLCLLVMPQGELASWVCTNALHRAQVLKGPHAWGLMLCSHCLEILNNFIFGFVFCKSSLVAGWTCVRALNTWLMLGPAYSPTLPSLHSLLASLDQFQPPAPAPGLWPLPLFGWSSPVTWAGTACALSSPLCPPGAWKQVQEDLGSGQSGSCSVLGCQCHSNAAGDSTGAFCPLLM